MDSSYLIKLISIGITIYYISKSNDRTSNWFAGLLITSLALTFFGRTDLNAFFYPIYLLALGTSLFFVIFRKIKTGEHRNLTIVFLLGILIKGIPQLFHLPYIWFYHFIALGAIGIYVYFQLNKRPTHILAITSIPVADCILTLASLIK